MCIDIVMRISLVIYNYVEIDNSVAQQNYAGLVNVGYGSSG